MTPADPARIHLLPAKAAPFVIVIRRKPSKCFHIVRWNTRTDELEHGSWFKGKLYPKRCDVSFDGNWMVYLAMGASSDTWNGVCNPPYLKTVVESENMGTWFGGGYWSDRKTLLLNQWTPDGGSLPFKLGQMEPEFGGEDLSVLYARWRRDGWVRRGENFGEKREVADSSSYVVECVGDDGWQHAPSREHPALVARFIGYLKHGYTFRFTLQEFPELLDDQVDSACWDSRGNLVYSRLGVLYRYTPKAIATGEPDAVVDLEPLAQDRRD